VRHRQHRLVDVFFLGREYPDVHSWMDEPYRWLGRRHRILRHDPLSILLKYLDDPGRLASAYLHIIADKSSSRYLSGGRRWHYLLRRRK